MKKQILFYSATTPTVMLYKIGFLLKKNNYETILFTSCQEDMFDKKFYYQAFDKIICSNFTKKKFSLKNFVKFFALLKIQKPDAVIGIAGSHSQLKIIRKYFFRNTKFIYLPYDVLSHYFSSREQALKSSMNPGLKQIEAEKYLFENSDGVIHKGGEDELDIIDGRLSKIKIECKTLSFHPYCSKDFIHEGKKLSKKDGNIHIVYAGFIASAPEHKHVFMNYFRAILKQKMHLHVYVHASHLPPEKRKEYNESLFDADVLNNEFFHLSNETFTPKGIVEEISKYDYALWMAYETDENNIEAKYSIGNKISTYLEAGLPIIYNKNSICLNKILEPYNLKIDFDKETMHDIGRRLRGFNYKELALQVKKLRQDFDMDKNFTRINNFIGLQK
jgi:hypothetical protein